MVVSPSQGDRSAGGHDARTGIPPANAAVWHELECGAYTADLALWRELATRAGTGAGALPLLDIGAGAGRVALDLSARGHRVTALDRDPELLRALCARAGEMTIETVCADARAFELSCREFAVCLVPMQTIQLLGGASDRIAFLRCARAHLRGGGLLAAAIVTEIEPFDCAAGDLGPAPESALVNGTRYLSRATRVTVSGQTVRIERERSVFAAAHASASTPAPQRAMLETSMPKTAMRERDVVELARVSSSELHREGAEAGLVPAGTLEIPATDEHVGSEVVLLHA
jgi:SAM-dependent methyltransferase